MAEAVRSEMASGSDAEMLRRVPSGALTLCPGCRSFGLEFGTLYIRLGADGLIGLAGMLERFAEGAGAGRRTERYRLGIRGTTLCLALWPAQLLALQQLVRAGLDVARRELGPPDRACCEWIH